MALVKMNAYLNYQLDVSPALPDKRYVSLGLEYVKLAEHYDKPLLTVATDCAKLDFELENINVCGSEEYQCHSKSGQWQI